MLKHLALMGLMLLLSLSLPTINYFSSAHLVQGEEDKQHVSKPQLTGEFSFFVGGGANRSLGVQRALQESCGVYSNKAKSGKLRLQKTVLISVAAFNQHHISHYKLYLANFMCYVKHYKMDIVLYLMHHHLTDLDTEVSSLRKLGVHVVSYPDDLFWSLVRSKSSPSLKSGRGHGDYTSNTPTFDSFGALVMLVPVLEVLRMGYNVIYFDVDVALVLDPVPYLVRGDADFVSSLELRKCTDDYPSSRGDTMNWHTVEPNTGIMHVRATSQGVRLFEMWVSHIIEHNAMNDQKYFDRTVFAATYTPNCNWNHSAYPTVRKNSASPIYCFLSEMLFQNGLTAIQCAAKAAFKHGWLVEMNKQGVHIYDNAKNIAVVTGKSGKLGSNIYDKQGQGTGRNKAEGEEVQGHGVDDGEIGAEGKERKKQQQKKLGIYPVAVHPNYAKGKSHELKIRGLWLVQHDSNGSVAFTGRDGKSNAEGEVGGKDASHCLPYKREETYYGTFEWEREVEFVQTLWNTILEEVKANGSVIQSDSGQDVYVVDEHSVRHVVPDKNTFEALFGDNWGVIRKVPNWVVNQLQLGNAVASVQ